MLLMLLTTAQTVLATDVDNLMFFKEQDTSTVNPDEPDGLVDPVNPANPTGTKKATAATAKRNNEWYNRLDFEDLTELQNAKRGLIEATPDLNITNANGEVWNMQSYKFLLNESGAPSTVNPSLWQNALCNVQCGLFQVCEGIYQVRGYDMANMSFIKTKNGWIIFDVLMCKEVAEAALDIFKRNIDSNPRIVAVLISHSHADHYGGVGAIVNAKNLADASLPLDQQLRPGKIAVITPEGFMKHVIAENAYCSAGMKRRAGYQYGADLPKGVTGRMAMGIGMGQSTNSPLTLIPPTFEMKNDTTVNIDGIDVTFQLTPGTEAPAEMNAYFPDYRALWMAENCTGTLHNLYTLRGAQVRDAEGWCNYILEAERKFGDMTDVVFQSHNWPHWGTAVIKEYLQNTAAVYKFTHDQTLHYVNLGLTPTEIADTLRLPAKLDKVWYTRQYYGTLSHNIKAVYQRYMGWYDANPVNLNLLTPETTAKKLVEYLGDLSAVMEKARADYEKGEYQWVAQITKELVYADPTNQEARDLCADALEQLGYQAESGPWRCAYLMGAWELREGNQAEKEGTVRGRETMLSQMTVEMMLDYIDINTDALAAQNDNLSLKMTIADTGEVFRVVRRDGVLLAYKGDSDGAADCSVTLGRLQLLSLMGGNTEVLDQLQSEGDATVLTRLVQYMTAGTKNFNIIEP